MIDNHWLPCTKSLMFWWYWWVWGNYFLYNITLVLLKWSDILQKTSNSVFKLSYSRHCHLFHGNPWKNSFPTFPQFLLVAIKLFIVYFWELLKQETKTSAAWASSPPAGTDCCCWHVFLLRRSRPVESEEPPCLRWVVHPIQGGLGPGASSCPGIQTHLLSCRWDTVYERWSLRHAALAWWKFVDWNTFLAV